MVAAVRVDGLREFRRGLSKLDKAFPKDLNREIKQVGERVAADARKSVPVRSGKARASIRATTAGSRAFIAGGKKAVPYYGWLDFGGGIPNKRSRQRRGLQNPWRSRPFVDEGRFLYPAVRRARPDLERDVKLAFNNARNRALSKGRL